MIWNNRRNISKRAIRGSGGVGILIRNSILNYFSVATLEEKVEGILWIELIGKKSVQGQHLGICVCYLPPISSSRGDISQEFWDDLRCLVLEKYQHGNFMICGDFNARIGSLSDCPDNSSIPNRKPIDHTTNTFGRLLVDFLHTLNMCTLNGRFDPREDGLIHINLH